MGRFQAFNSKIDFNLLVSKKDLKTDLSSALIFRGILV